MRSAHPANWAKRAAVGARAALPIRMQCRSAGNPAPNEALRSGGVIASRGYQSFGLGAEVDFQPHDGLSAGQQPVAHEDGEAEGNLCWRGERLRDKIAAQLAAIKRMPQLVRSFFQAPTVAYITDC